MKLILASSSKNRKELLDMVGFKYEIIRSDEAEKSNEKEPSKYVIELSKIKANSVANKINEKALIISADSVIYMNGKIFEKPKNKKEAFENMKLMSGKVTYAVTGITIKDLYQNKEISFSRTTEVWFKEISEEEISWYVENDENILTRCGYSVAGKGAIFVDKIVGDYNNLIGIPLSEMYLKFKELGYLISDFEMK